MTSKKSFKDVSEEVTILILIDGFLQYNNRLALTMTYGCHNPYFNRWFSAIPFYRTYKTDYMSSQSLF